MIPLDFPTTRGKVYNMTTTTTTTRPLHVTSVRADGSGYAGSPQTAQARCTCGETFPVRDTWTDAEHDRSAHNADTYVPVEDLTDEELLEELERTEAVSPNAVRVLDLSAERDRRAYDQPGAGEDDDEDDVAVAPVAIRH